MPDMPSCPVVELPRLDAAKWFADTEYVPPHTHTGPELILVTEGRCTVGVQDLKLEGAPDILFVLPARVPHDQINHEFTRNLFVAFTVGRQQFDDRARAIPLENDTRVRRWMEELCELYKPRIGLEVAGGLVWSLIAHVSRLENQFRTRSLMHPKIARAFEFLEEHLVSPMELEQMADCADLSTSHLTALFRKQFGCGPMKYRQEQRMKLARDLLLNPYLTVTEVAKQCGYEDINYFSRLFRKCNGVSPGKWRDRLSKDA